MKYITFGVDRPLEIQLCNCCTQGYKLDYRIRETGYTSCISRPISCYEMIKLKNLLYYELNK